MDFNLLIGWLVGWWADKHEGHIAHHVSVYVCVLSMGRIFEYLI